MIHYYTRPLKNCFFALLLLITGCGSKFSPYLSESWSENYALASNNGKALPPEINDGKLDSFGVTEYPERSYMIVLPQRRKVNRVLVYSGNVISYELFFWNSVNNKWESIGGVGRQKGRQKVYSDTYKLTTPRFDHRVNVETDKIKLVVDRASKDGIVTTRTPKKNDKIINQRIEYMNIGNERVRVELYDVFMFSKATIREIEIYSQQKGKL